MDQSRTTTVFDRYHRWMYPHDRPGRLARALNAGSAWAYGAGVLDWFGHGVRLEVRGRSTGTVHALPLASVVVDGERYLVSMLGPQANWVRNVRADDGRAVLRRRGAASRVRLVEVDPATTAPILREYLRVAPGARPHVPVDRRAPLEEFAAVAHGLPVFRVTPWAPRAS